MSPGDGDIAGLPGGEADQHIGHGWDGWSKAGGVGKVLLPPNFSFQSISISILWCLAFFVADILRTPSTLHPRPIWNVMTPSSSFHEDVIILSAPALFVPLSFPSVTKSILDRYDLNLCSLKLTKCLFKQRPRRWRSSGPQNLSIISIRLQKRRRNRDFPKRKACQKVGSCLQRPAQVDHLLRCGEEEGDDDPEEVGFEGGRHLSQPIPQSKLHQHDGEYMNQFVTWNWCFWWLQSLPSRATAGLIIRNDTLFDNHFHFF